MLPVHFHYLLGLLDLSLFSLLSLSSLSLFSLSSSCFFMEASFSCSICATKYQHLTQRQHTDLIKYACPTPANICFRTGTLCPDRILLIPKCLLEQPPILSHAHHPPTIPFKRIPPVVVLFLLSSVPEMQLEYQQCFLVHLIAVATVLP